MKKYIVEVHEDRTIWKNEQGQYHCEHGPAFIWPNGTVEYCQNGKLHREDGPAIIRSDGSVEYWQNGLRHREDGPAIIWFGGSSYFLNDIKYSKKEWEQELEKRKTKELTVADIETLLGHKVKIVK